MFQLIPPLVKGKKKGKLPTFEWNALANDSFNLRKEKLIQAPVLSYPNFSESFVLEVDALLKGLRACLSQVGENGRRHPIAYASRQLEDTDKKYPDLSSFKLELLALKWAVVDKFRDHLLGVPFVIFTDNNPLAHLQNAKLGATEMRWVAQLAPLNV